MTTDREALNKLFEAALKQPEPTPSPRAATRGPYSSASATRARPRGNTATSTSRLSPGAECSEPTATPRTATAPVNDRHADVLAQETPSAPAAQPAVVTGETIQTIDRAQNTRELQRLLQDKNQRENGRRRRLILMTSLTAGVILSVAGAWFLSSPERRDSMFFSAEKIRAQADMNRYASGKAMTIPQAPKAPDESTGTDATPAAAGHDASTSRVD